MDIPRDDQDRQEFLLSQYLDGDLAGPARSQLERQLADDPNLSARLEQLRRTERLIKSSAPPVPELDWDRFTEEVARRREQFEQARRRRRRLRLFVPLSAAAAVMLLVTVLRVVDRQGPSGGPPQPVAEVSMERGPAGLDSAFAEVSVVRTLGLQVVETSRRDRGGVAVATVTRAGPVIGQAAPYF